MIIGILGEVGLESAGRSLMWGTCSKLWRCVIWAISSLSGYSAERLVSERVVDMDDQVRYWDACYRCAAYMSIRAVVMPVNRLEKTQEEPSNGTRPWLQEHNKTQEHACKQSIVRHRHEPHDRNNSSLSRVLASNLIRPSRTIWTYCALWRRHLPASGTGAYVPASQCQ